MASRNPNYRQFVLPDGYTDVGYVNFGPIERVNQCVASKHELREFDNSMYQSRSTDVIKICDTCKIVWHIDMSD
jgi:hypothetical protein